MPAEGLNKARRDFLLAIVVSDRFAEKFSVIRSAQRFKRIGVQSMAADSGKDRVEQVTRQNARRADGAVHWLRFCHVMKRPLNTLKRAKSQRYVAFALNVSVIWRVCRILKKSKSVSCAVAFRPAAGPELISSVSPVAWL